MSSRSVTATPRGSESAWMRNSPAAATAVGGESAWRRAEGRADRTEWQSRALVLRTAAPFRSPAPPSAAHSPNTEKSSGGGDESEGECGNLRCPCRGRRSFHSDGCGSAALWSPLWLPIGEPAHRTRSCGSWRLSGCSASAPTILMRAPLRSMSEGAEGPPLSAWVAMRALMADQWPRSADGAAESAGCKRRGGANPLTAPAAHTSNSSNSSSNSGRESQRECCPRQRLRVGDCSGDRPMSSAVTAAQPDVTAARGRRAAGRSGVAAAAWQSEQRQRAATMESI